MRLADYVMHRIADLGLRDIFGVYGSAVVDFYDVLARGDEPRIKLVATIHEQAAGFAAEGYAKVHTCGFGVAMGTSGPGATNLLTAVANCWYDSVPVLFLTGNPPRRFLRREHGGGRQVGFQELPIVDVARPITKYSARVDAGDLRAVGVLDTALHCMLTRRKGPVLLDFPADVQKDELTGEMLSAQRSAFAGPRENRLHELDRLCQDLAASCRPAVLVGGGCRGYERKLATLAEKFRLPLFPTWNAVDLVDSGSLHYGGRVGTYGGPGRNFAAANCDLLLCLGTRVSGRITGGAPETFARHAKRWLVNLEDAEELGSSVRFDRTIRSDVGVFLASLPARAPGWPDARIEWLRQVAAWRDRYDPVEENRDKPVPGGGINPYLFVEALSTVLPPTAVVIADCGGNAAVTFQALKTKKGQRVFSSHGNSPMGGALCYGIGAAVADPDRLVVVLIGDGGMQVNIQELETLCIYRKRLQNLRVFILNNHSYGITRAYQRTNLGGRYIACGPEPESGYAAPDFSKIVSAYGVSWNRTAPGYGDGSGLVPRLSHHLFEEHGPLVVDVDCGVWDTYEPRTSGWERPIEEATPSLPKEEFLANMRWIDPVPGWEDRRQRA